MYGTPLQLEKALVDDGWSLRAEGDGDVRFLRDLFASTRADELAQVADWSDAQKRSFLDQQFDAQRLHYRTRIVGCMFWIVERHDVAAGRLYLQQREANLHIVDIALLPDWRGRGVGESLLRAVIEAAGQSRRGVGIFVERFNRALSLYRRLGFVSVGGNDVYLEMERPAVLS